MPANEETSPVVSLSELALTRQAHGDRFDASFAPISAPKGGRHLGARLTEVSPGKCAWPFHCHHGNDEIFVILDGSGTLRHGSEEWPVTAGDVVVCAAGGAETAHQLTAGDTTLRYIAISTMREPDVMEYPDSGKVTVFAGSAPGGNKAERRLAATWRKSDCVDYWSGE